MRTTNTLFPIFLKLDTLHTLIVGGGTVGYEKLFVILKSSPEANVTLVAKKISEEIKVLVSNKPYVILIERNFESTDLYNKDLVVLATADRNLHKKIRAMKEDMKFLINVADTPDLCDFYLGSIITKGNLKMGISTNGKSPTFAKRLREYFETILPEGTEELISNLNKVRDTLKGDLQYKIKELNMLTSSWLHDKNQKNKMEELA